MQAPGENAISIVDSQTETYADNNLNEKALSTQYIYTTEGKLIPATEEVSATMDMDTQHFDTAQAAETESIHIQPVDYQYQQQFSDGTMETVPSDNHQFVQDVSVCKEPPFVVSENTYIPENQATIETETVPEETPTNSYEYPPTSENYEPSTTTPPEQNLNFDVKSDSQDESKEIQTPKDKEDYAANEAHSEVPSTESGQDSVVLENVSDVGEVESTDNVKNSNEVESIEPEHDELQAVEQNMSELHTEENIQETVEQVVPNEIEVTKEVPVPVSAEECHTIVDGNPIELKKESKEDTQERAQSIKTDLVIEETKPETVDAQVIEELQTDQNIEIEHRAITADLIACQANVEIIDEDAQRELEESTQDTIEQSEVQETMVIVYEDSSQEGVFDDDSTYVQELEDSQSSTQITDNQDAKPRRPRGRKPKKDIPLHILGHSVNKPVDNVINGKTPKPRLGVKVPYRNLTSQIVSKQEIEKEIIERGLKKQKRELSFARQLTARLAKKLASTAEETLSKEISAATEENSDLNKAIEKEIQNSSTENSTADNDAKEKTNKDSSDSIDNNSDLLAILEGNDESDDIILPKSSKPTEQKENESLDDASLKNMEREIALQQLQDLPYLSPSTRFVKGRLCKPFFKALPNVSISPDGTASINPSPKPTVSSQTKTRQSELKTAAKPAVVKQTQDKKLMDVEPQIKVNMALKTYSRKRKSLDNIPEPQPSKKSPVTVSTTQIDLKPAIQQPNLVGGAYVTKSSRIIKKKVIWDPDEIPVRSLTPKTITIKSEFPSPQKIIVKATQSKIDNKVTEKIEKTEKKGEPKANIEKKSEEKTSPRRVTHIIVSPDKKPASAGNKIIAKPKKSRSEVDKLLGDEGTIKMLYDLKTSEEHVEEKRRKNVISVERTFKDLAKKANLIKSDLVNISAVESPKSLRKKEAVTPVLTPKPQPPSPAPASPTPSAISRQKSKDSARSTPPRSPTFFPNETSYLIRRRSSSSISSGGEGSIELNDDQERLLRRKNKGSPLSETRPKRTKRTSDQKEPEGEDLKQQKRSEHRIGHYNTFIVRRTNRSFTIDLHSEDKKGYFTLQVLEELTTVLNKISKEKDCNVVLIRSFQEKIFSGGMDYSSLVIDKENERKNKATDLAEKVRDFIKCLLHFPKILIAGIEGECSGLGVTMLPLFDIVIATDTASFQTKFNLLGTIPEAGFLLSAPFIASHGLAAELLYTSQSLTADEACRKGLITRLCWPEKYQETVKQLVVSVSKGSKQSLEATKKHLRFNHLENADAALESMKKQLVEFWTSPECQKTFSNVD